MLNWRDFDKQENCFPQSNKKHWNDSRDFCQEYWIADMINGIIFKVRFSNKVYHFCSTISYQMIPCENNDWKNVPKLARFQNIWQISFQHFLPHFFFEIYRKNCFFGYYFYIIPKPAVLRLKFLMLRNFLCMPCSTKSCNLKMSLRMHHCQHCVTEFLSFRWISHTVADSNAPFHHLTGPRFWSILVFTWQSPFMEIQVFI